MENLIITISRTCVSFLILMIVSLWIGKQVNSGNNHYNFALSITIGAFIANMGFDTYLKFIPMLAAFLALIAMYFLSSLISTHSRRFRLLLSGEPTVVMENGKILDGNMKKVRYTLDDLNQQLREQGIFDVFQVEYALLEVSGKLSVMKKKKFQSLTKGDFHPTQQNSKIQLPIELIMDGTAVEKNFSSHYSSTWLNQELKLRNLQMQEIQYAVISSSGSLFIDLFEDHIKAPLDRE
ncbi:hypothetical protein BAVI_04019 [Neobacillus vireti LMG 21834]|uniref:YetF C-terminal domain-containing protein n=1 Tax=Neobacillus vireti LMG 21834 TaxID=1131730 RepID=A0AB94ITE2_9BACI|nr:DUF421 domain-containing protein [Neobacillus vireti]ETI70223.1 hypothetical protein BAVI_04019 [Neobacillus vireti LMG 21834]KLT16590.1 hypothetical protein AA980_18225 [Neobacillus vireti]